jgi:hypothetical protein
MASSPPTSPPTQPDSPLGSWSAYFAALARADQDWAVDYGGKFGIFTGRNSHFNTIRAAQPIFKHDWQSLSPTEARILLGLIDSDGADYGHLGAMKAAGAAKNVFLDPTPQNLKTRSSIQDAINSVLVVPLSDSLPLMARRAHEIITNRDGFSVGVATRLLALARPEVLVSVNNESVKRLAQWSGIPAATIKTSSGYEKFVRWVMNGKWWKTPAPQEPFEREVWSYRAALIDGLIYEGQHFRDHL